MAPPHPAALRRGGGGEGEGEGEGVEKAGRSYERLLNRPSACGNATPSSPVEWEREREGLGGGEEGGTERERGEGEGVEKARRSCERTDYSMSTPLPRGPERHREHPAA